MPKANTIEEIYEECEEKGMIRFQEDVDVFKVKSMVKNAKSDLLSITALKNSSNPQWSSIYKLGYDVIHSLAEALLRFDKIKLQNHRCLFAYICVKKPELEFSWDFFEKIRTKRNGVSYYGQNINKKDWDEIELQLNLYASALEKEIEKRIDN